MRMSHFRADTRTTIVRADGQRISKSGTRRSALLRVLICLCSVSLVSPVAGDERPAPLALTGATVIDGISDDALDTVAIVVEGDSIRAIINEDEGVPPDTRVLDLRGKFVIPGLIDSHVHWLDWMGELFVNHGVTSVVALAELEQDKRRLSHTSLSVPRLYHSAKRPPFSAEDSSDEIREVVKAWLLKEPDIAHFPTFDDESARAYGIAASEVHRAGYLIFGHAENAARSIASGHDVVEHVWAFTQAVMTDTELAAFQRGEHLTWATFMTDAWDRLDPLIRTAVDSGIYLNPTLVYEWGGMSRDAARRELDDYRLLSNPDLVYFPDNIAKSLLAKHRQIKNFSSRFENMPYVAKLGAAERARFEEGYRNVQEFIRRFVAAGGKIQAGTDTISGGMPGLGLHQEMQMLVEAGLTPMQALKAATRWSAELLEGKDGRRGPAAIGSLEPGKRADLVVLDADPRVDIRNTQKISRVMKNGRWIELGYHPEYYTFTEPSRSIAGSTFAPVISSIAPAVVTAGHRATRIVIHGSGFQMTSFVQVDGITVKTEFLSPLSVAFLMPAELIASPRPDPYRAPGPKQETGVIGYRSIDIRAVNPPPEGGTSNSVHLLVRP